MLAGLGGVGRISSNSFVFAQLAIVTLDEDAEHVGLIRHGVHRGHGGGSHNVVQDVQAGGATLSCPVHRIVLVDLTLGHGRSLVAIHLNLGNTGFPLGSTIAVVLVVGGIEHAVKSHGPNDGYIGQVVVVLANNGIHVEMDVVLATRILLLPVIRRVKRLGIVTVRGALQHTEVLAVGLVGIGCSAAFGGVEVNTGVILQGQLDGGVAHVHLELGVGVIVNLLKGVVAQTIRTGVLDGHLNRVGGTLTHLSLLEGVVIHARMVVLVGDDNTKAVNKHQLAHVDGSAGISRLGIQFLEVAADGHGGDREGFLGRAADEQSFLLVGCLNGNRHGLGVLLNVEAEGVVCGCNGIATMLSIVDVNSNLASTGHSDGVSAVTVVRHGNGGLGAAASLRDVDSLGSGFANQLASFLSGSGNSNGLVSISRRHDRVRIAYLNTVNIEVYRSITSGRDGL